MEIKLKNIQYIKNNHTKISKTIIDNLNVTIKENQITSFVGPNGSGKSSIAKLIALLDFPTKGEIDYQDLKITNKSNKENLNKLRPQIGIVYQNPNQQFFCNTVKEEIEFAIDNLNYQTKDKEKRIKDSLKLVHLDPKHLNKNPRNLSKGQQWKLSLAITLSFNPKVLILDEPTLELDSNNKKQLIKIIKMMKLRYNKTIIIFSKDTDFVHEISDYVYIFNDGKIIIEGDKYEVFTNEKILKQNNLTPPKIIEFVNLVEKKKNVKIGYRDDINDLMKDVYRYVR